MVLCFLFAALIVVLDQFFKQWIVRTIELGGRGPELIPGILGLTHWENDGAMLNFLSGQQWLLAAVAFVAAVVLIMILLRYNEGFWGTLALSAVLGGTVGNLFDRVFNDGKVIDMFRTLFVNFPIFNIADIFITLGFITFLVHFIILTVKGDEKENQVAKHNKVIVPVERFEGDIPSEEEPQATVPVYAEQPVAYQQQVPVYTEEVPVYTQPVTYQQQSPAVPQQTIAAQTAQTAQTAQPAAAAPQYDYGSYAGSYDTATDTTPEISLTLEALEAELGSLDVDYDVDELLREYGIENDDISV